MGRVVAGLTWMMWAVGLLVPCCADDIDFASDVFPILRRRCIECHGAGLKESGLRLDDARALQAVKVVTKGQPEHSELWRRVTLGEDSDERMPPTGDRLPAAELAVLRSWIQQGAVVPGDFQPPPHWAWQVPVRPQLPEGLTGAAAIDRLVQQRLVAAGLEAAPAAPPAVLLRRLSFDLIGLPPSVEQVQAFERDPSAEHYAQLVEQLLASPQFGERWARHWLDLARYADSHGFQRDDLRELWAWRDWVIRALNADLPFDQFTIEQLAGDLLPNPTESQRIATGFHRCTPVNVEAGSLPEETRAEQLIDRVNTTATVWLGATLECAQCHDHKYDPFTQSDYYRLLAFFNQTAIEADRQNPNQPSSIAFIGPELTLSHPERDARRRAVTERLAALRTELQISDSNSSRAETSRQARKRRGNVAGVPNAPAARAESATLPAGVRETVLQLTDFQSQGVTDEWRLLEDGSLLITGADPPATDLYSVTIREIPGDMRAIRLDALTHADLPGRGPGRGSADRPNFVLHEMIVELEEPDGRRRQLEFSSAWSDFAQQSWAAAGAVDGRPKTGWAIAPQFGRDHFLVAVLREPLQAEAGAVLRVQLQQNFGSARTLGRFRLTGISGGLPEQPAAASEELGQQQQTQELTALERELESLRPETSLVMVEQSDRRENYIFERGDYRRKGVAVEPGIPGFLTPPPSTGNAPAALRTRLDLARWLVSRENPLAARAAVNRWWAEFFGEGLVSTPEDFGVKGDPPTHPELLDWLAVELMDSGWSMKHVLRQIVLSRTYQQSSVHTSAGRQVDERNRLLWRGPSFRMDAEMIRDNLLAVSGLLSLKQFGPPIRPPQPEGLWAKVGGTQYEYRVSEGEDLWRRGIYVVLKRSAMHPSLMTFDGPARLSCTVRRSRTNTPQQALALLNDPVSVSAAQALGARVLRELPQGTDEARLERMVRLCVARCPRVEEFTVLAGLLAAQRVALEQRPEDAAMIAGPLPVGVDDPSTAVIE
ncbi:MAG: PSD1 and planctomycete cytochrome C domain-containing protein, partial [Planctomycetaceae bacterium]